jgi:hypothetical protein
MRAGTGQEGHLVRKFSSARLESGNCRNTCEYPRRKLRFRIPVSISNLPDDLRASARCWKETDALPRDNTKRYIIRPAGTGRVGDAPVFGAELEINF